MSRNDNDIEDRYQQEHRKGFALFQRKQAEAAAEAERQAVVARYEAQEKARLEYREKSDCEARRRQLADLRTKVSQQQVWQNSASIAARKAVVQQQDRAMLGRAAPVIAALERHLNPPPEPAEPEPEVLDWRPWF